MVIFMELFFEDLESWRRDAEINGKRYSIVMSWKWCLLLLTCKIFPEIVPLPPPGFPRIKANRLSSSAYASIIGVDDIGRMLSTDSRSEENVLFKVFTYLPATIDDDFAPFKCWYRTHEKCRIDCLLATNILNEISFESLCYSFWNRHSTGCA